MFNSTKARRHGAEGSSRTTYSSSSVSWAISGTVIVPETSSSPGAEPNIHVSPGTQLTNWPCLLTGVLEYQLDIKDGDDLALTLADINIAVHALDLDDLGLDIAILSPNLEEVVLKPLTGPS